MHDEAKPAEENPDVAALEATTGRELTEAEQYFCMRIALGDTVIGASRAVNRDARTGFRWLQRPEIEAEIRKAAAQAVDSARRVIVGKVRWAARRMLDLGKPGGSAHKGAAVEFAALKYILDVNRVSEIQVGGTQSRIFTFVPRDERDELPIEVQDTLSVIDAQFREEALPRIATSDGLPPDFPRAEGERDGGYAQPTSTTPPELSDPGYFRRTLFRE